MSLNRFQNVGSTSSSHAYNQHTIAKHPWKTSKFLNKKFRKSTRSLGSDNATITTESTGLSSQSSLLSKPFVSPISSRKTSQNCTSITPETQSSPCSPESHSKGITSPQSQHNGITSPGRVICSSRTNLSMDKRLLSLSNDSGRERTRSVPRSTRGIDTNDELTRPPPQSPRFNSSPKSAVSSTRPRSISHHSRCSSSGSYSSAGSNSQIPRPPKSVNRKSDSPSLVRIQASTKEADTTSQLGPIDVDSMEAWQEEASVESSLLMMGIEDPKETLRTKLETPLVDTNCHLVQKSWKDPKWSAMQELTSHMQKQSITSNQTSETLEIGDSPVWRQGKLEDDALELSSDGSEADDDCFRFDMDNEQDVDPLAPFMRLERMDDLLAESDSEDDYLQIQSVFHRGFPILDEREEERILCGYQSFDVIPELSRPKETPPPQAPDRAFEI